jgi:xylulokinase
MFETAQNRCVTQHRHVALGVDIGTTNTKVVVVVVDDSSARELRRVSLPTPKSGAALRDAVLHAIENVTRADGERVESVGITSMAETGSLIDRSGNPFGDLLRWNHGSDDAVNDVVSSVGAAALFEATGVPVPAKTPVAHWLKLNRDGYSGLAAARWGGAADLVALALTGDLVTDHTLAARTMAYRSAALGETLSTSFAPELAGLGGFTVDRLPRVLAPGSAAGVVTAEAARRTGLTAGIPVFIAGHDHAVGAWAAGARGDGEAADSVGTAEALFRVSAAPIPREAARAAGMSVARTIDGAHESLLAGNPTAGALVEWAFQTVFPTAVREETLAAAAGRAPTWTGTPLVLPYLRGRQAPHPDPRAVFRVVGRSGETASLPSEPADALVAILGGLVLQLAWLDAAQNEVVGAGASDGALHVLGGPGAANDAWWTLKRALLPRELRRIASPEPVAIGAGVWAARASTGMSPALPASAATSAGRERLPEERSSALLADFIAAATAGTAPVAAAAAAAHETARPPASETPTYR